MADDDLIIRQDEPDPHESRPHPIQEKLNRSALRVSWFALGVAGLSAWFAFLQWRAAERQAESAEAQVTLADKALAIAIQAAKDQKDDIEQARKAAARSANAAELLAKTSSKTADASEKSADAASQSAVAGQQSVELSRRAVLLGNEPRVSLMFGSLKKPLAVGEKPRIILQIQNAGKGTAYGVSASVWMDLLEKPQFTYKPELGRGSIMDMPPTSQPTLKSELDLGRVLTQGDLAKIKDHKLTLYAYGLITYSDSILGTTRRTQVHFCQKYHHDPISEDLTLAACEEHNFTSVE